MENKFIIESRYEIWSSIGKTFCKWYVCNSKSMTENEANEYIKKIKNDFGFIDKKTKLKHEYRLKSYKEFEEENRKLAESNAAYAKHQEEYYKSDAYKELQRKKRQAAKERKEKQKKYLEIYNHYE